MPSPSLPAYDVVIGWALLLSGGFMSVWILQAIQEMDDITWAAVFGVSDALPLSLAVALIGVGLVWRSFRNRPTQE